SQTSTLLSAPADAISMPSGANDTATTGAACSLNVRASLPVALSQSRTVLSCEAVASSVPRGDTATALMGPACPSRMRNRLPVLASHCDSLSEPIPVIRALPAGHHTGGSVPERLPNWRSVLPVALSWTAKAAREPVMNVAKSGLTANDWASATAIVVSNLPAAASQTLMLSGSKVANCLPPSTQVS